MATTSDFGRGFLYPDGGNSYAAIASNHYRDDTGGRHLGGISLGGIRCALSRRGLRRLAAPLTRCILCDRQRMQYLRTALMSLSMGPFIIACALGLALTSVFPSTVYARSKLRALQPKIIFSGHNRDPSALAFSHDSLYIAAGGADGKVDLWDLRAHKIIRTLESSSKILTIVFPPDAHQLAAALANGSIKIWNVKSGRLLSSMEIPSPAISLAYSPDGHSLVSASRDGTVRVWAPPGKLVRSLDGIVSSTISIVDGPRIAGMMIGLTGPKLRGQWDLATGELVTLRSNSTLVPNWPPSAFDNPTLSPNGQLVALRSCLLQVPMCGIEIVEAETGRVLWEFLPLVGSFAFSLDGKKLALGSFNDIQICDVESLKECSRVELGGRKLFPVSIAFSAADNWLASGFDDGTVRIWKLR
jgi:WD40 repeat protein